MVDATPEDWPEGRIVAGHYLKRYGRVPPRLAAFVDDPDDDPGELGTVGRYLAADDQDRRPGMHWGGAGAHQDGDGCQG